MFLLFNTLSRFAMAFLPRSKHFLISWLQSSSTMILELKKRKSVTISTFSLSICHEVMGPNAMIFVFWMLSFKPFFPLSSFTLIKRLFSSSSFSALRVESSAYLRLLIFLPAILIPLSFHYLLEFAQTHVHAVSDTIQPSDSLSSPSPPALSLSQHQGLFQWVSSSHQVAKVLDFQLQHQSFQWIFRVDFL